MLTPPVDPYRLLLVCTANVCRSPMAQGVLESALAARGLAGRVAVDSAGTYPARIGQPPDAQAQAQTAARGIDIAAQRSRLVAPADFETFDLVLAMDRQNLNHLRYLCPRMRRDRLKLYLEFSRGWRKDVPDPVGGTPARFAKVMALIERGAPGVVAYLLASLATPVPAPGEDGCDDKAS